jgi:hypothetical protein
VDQGVVAEIDQFTLEVLLRHLAEVDEIDRDAECRGRLLFRLGVAYGGGVVRREDDGESRQDRDGAELRDVSRDLLLDGLGEGSAFYQQCFSHGGFLKGRLRIGIAVQSRKRLEESGS